MVLHQVYLEVHFAGDRKINNCFNAKYKILQNKIYKNVCIMIFFSLTDKMGFKGIQMKKIDFTLYFKFDFQK